MNKLQRKRSNMSNLSQTGKEYSNKTLDRTHRRNRNKSFNIVNQKNPQKPKNLLSRLTNVGQKSQRTARYSFSSNGYKQNSPSFTHRFSMLTMKKNKSAKSLHARKDSEKDGLSGGTTGILLTGGLDCYKGGILRVKLQNTASVDKIVYLREGVLTICGLDDEVECELGIVELSDIVYKNKKTTYFDLVFRKIKFMNEKFCEDPEPVEEVTFSVNKRDTLRSKFSKMSIQSLTSRRSTFYYSAQKKRFTFKAISGEEASQWIQVLLFELRNQAFYLQKSIGVYLKKQEQQRKYGYRTDANTVIRKGSSKKKSSQNNQAEHPISDKLESMYRQSVDMWSLAKGKSSVEAIKAVEELSQYLLLVDEAEANFWMEIKESLEQEKLKIDKMQSQTGRVKLPALMRLQELNELQYHSEGSPNPKYRPVDPELLARDRNRKDIKTFRSIGKLESARELKDRKDHTEEMALLNNIQHQASERRNQLYI
eukprot:snap_masked-scaffold_4-processed-gene-3.11-mRNA-1 protein AED:1.00 eAED:1.00 QI:0/-1/0/0/-1/1/1/0/480